MKDIAILVTAPEQVLPYHREIFAGFDLFFVTYSKYHPDALSFNQGMSWAYNRNSLYQQVPKNYHYYCFVDYDIELESVGEGA